MYPPQETLGTGKKSGSHHFGGDCTSLFLCLLMTNLEIFGENQTFQKHEFVIVDPYDFVLFQAADYISTLELINLKFSEGKNSKSEISFFKDQRSFTKNYYHHITLKRL